MLLLDLWLPDGDALALARELRESRSRIRIIACTARSDDVVLHHFDRLALEGMIWKETSLPPTLRSAIATVRTNGRHFPPELAVARRNLRANPHAWYKLLSDREQELLPLLGLGIKDADVASIAGVSRETAHSHRRNVMRKLGLHRTVELAAWARQAGFVPPVSPQSQSSSSFALER